MDFKELADKRYSCRKFSDRRVEPELINTIIETANRAPTAVNKQPFKIFALESETAKNALKETCRYTFGAETFLVVGAKDDEGWTRKFDNRPFADVDASIVATHIMMQLEDLGLATTWVACFDAPKLKELLPALAPYDLIAVFPIGYAADDAEPFHMHNSRKAKDDIYAVL